MEPTEFPPITEDEVQDALKEADSWYRYHWGATMPPAQCRGMAKDVVRLVALVRQLQSQLNRRGGAGANTDEDFHNNPCTMCGSPPSVRCEHDE